MTDRALPESHRAAVLRLADDLAETSIPWALTGSASFVLQGVPLTPGDVDVQTDRGGARAIADRFADAVAEPVTPTESERMRSVYGALTLGDVRVEIMGAVQKRREDGSWEDPVDVTDHRRFVTVDGRRIPVLSLEYEATAYERLGRAERAALLRSYAAES
ncbi:MAG: nucleotidyltransferase domain-containing protein [Halanaeroarchaeum sp.]